MPDQTSQDIHNEQSNQGAQSMFNAPATINHGEPPLLPTLCITLAGGSTGLDICVGYFNLRGWQSLSDLVDVYSGTKEGCCRLIVGMQRPPHDLMKRAQSFQCEECLDGTTVARLQREAACTFREQLEFGLPSAQAEATLRQLACPGGPLVCSTM